jgi:hypothetical protein
VNCEFCGSIVLPGAKLCGACRSALKRARNDPQSILEPLARRASDTLQRRKSRRSPADGDDHAAMIPAPVRTTARRSATPAIAGVFAVVACIIGYALLQHLDGGARADPAVQAAEPVVAASAPSATMQPANPEPGATAESTADPAIAPIVQPAGIEPESVPHPAAKPKRIRAKDAQPVVPPPVVESQPVTLSTPPPASAPVVKAPAAPPDRRALLRTAIGKCDGETLEKAFCEQRARLDLCDGLWGTVPQCPAQRDYGN